MKNSGFMSIIQPSSDFPYLGDGEYTWYQKAKLFSDCLVIASPTADSMIVYGNSIGNFFHMVQFNGMNLFIVNNYLKVYNLF